MFVNMILFFYGEDTYRLKQKLNRLKEKFISSSLGDTNLAILDGKTITFDEMARQILAVPFLAKKRLVIIENLMRDGKKSAQGRDLAKGGEIQEKMTDFLKKVPDSTVLVFVEEGAPDRRTVLFRRLNRPGQAQEFKLLEGEALRRWLRQEVSVRGGEIDSSATNKLIEYVGSDLWRMKNEIDKLTAYSLQLTAKEVELLVAPQVQANIFELIEAVAAKMLQRGLRELYQLLQGGFSEIYIMTMIIYQYRNLLLAKDGQERASNPGLHPYVLRKITPLLGQYELEELKKIYEKLLSVEISIKTGKIEPRVALELLIFQLTR